MSVVLATSDFMLGDKRISDDSGACLLPQLKVFRSRSGLLAGCAGNFSAVVAVQAAMERGAETPADLVAAIDDESEGLAVWQGRIYYVCNLGATAVRAPYYGIGSGADSALGYLAGAGACDEATCRAAIRFACTRRADCGDGTRLVRS